MFSITEQRQNGFYKIIISNKKKSCQVEILPDFGAILNAFILTNKNEAINIIDGYQTVNEFLEGCELNGFKSAKLSPFICRLKNGSYRIKKKEYKTSGFYHGQHALHGLLYRCAFKLIKTKKLKNSAYAVLQYKYRQDDKGFPFCYNCTIKYELKQKNKFTITTTVSNKGKTKIPVTDGWHPYFTLSDTINNLEMQMQVSDKLIFDNELLPTGETEKYKAFEKFTKIEDAVFDNCFTVKKGAKTALQLKDPSTGLTLKIKPQSNYPYLQIYTPAHRRSIAIENLSAAPDAFNNKIGLMMLEKNKSKKFIASYEVKL